MTPFRAVTAARLALLALGVAFLAQAAAGKAVSIALPAALAAGWAAASGALAWSFPRGLGRYASAGLLAADAAWMGWSAWWCGVPIAADTWLLGPAALAGAAAGFLPGLGVAAGVVAVYVALSLSGGGDLPGTLLRASMAPIAAAAAGFAVDCDRKDRLARLKASLGSQHRLQVAELFQYALFQVREYMTSVTSVTEALALQGQNTPLADKLTRLRGLVQECNGKIGRLMDAMRARATARRAPGEPASYELAELLDEVARTAESVAAGAPVSISVSGQRGVALKHDRPLIRDLVAALVQNAVEASSARGGRVSLSGKSGEKFVEIEVTDEAGGVPDELLGEIFQPLFTTKEASGGLGLGLSMTRRIARSVGGNLEVVTDGRRTTARLSLPPEAGLPQVFTGDSTWAGRRGEAGRPPQG